ncbi:adenylate/guanylate cyclase domain-containing protein [Sinorhizobium sp. Sb3]|uniref:adenylate/guanylate cyclase domain-containing protein n=1 Tax=Sinorhizobium sp. Sb3 TaxID=1358417 RepID=UPI0009E9EF9E|nr:adenylate/guanylate cyclase domain-containing protein [Sinorhizobium sp. Sb3]
MPSNTTPDQSPSAPIGFRSSGVQVFLLTDVEGSTYRWEEYPDAMQEALERHDELLYEAIGSRGGHVFKTVGDSFHTVFSSPIAAVTAALAAQRALTAEDFSATDGFQVRMAVHAGPVEFRSGDYFGPGINRAARLLLVAYGGQVLISGTVVDLLQGRLPADATLFDLGRHRFRDLPGAEHVYQLVAPGIQSAFPPLRSLGAVVHQLPHPLTPLVGRDDEISEILRRLERCRLLTLIGAGGAGKTRLAIEAGYRLATIYPDGVWFIELGLLDDPQLVAEQICGVVGVPVQSGRTAVASAVGFLREKRALLVLDNCEHLVAAAAAVAEAISSECASMSVLGTSREPLGVAGESIFRVPNLGVPAPDELVVSEALKSPAVRLFVDRANAVAETFQLTDENLQAVVDICTQVDGIPLAIELAVPRLRMMRPESLAARLKDSFRSLDRGSRTVPLRQRTLSTMFEWSYNLLDEREQTLLRRLAVFAGGWTAESAAAVVSGDPVAEEEILELIVSLADKSLVAAMLSADETRYRLLETTRQYSLDKLRENGEKGRRRRLAEFMCRFYEEANRRWPTMSTVEWSTRYRPEMDNLRASLEWAFGSDGDIAVALRLTSFSLRLWDEMALLPERERWFRTATQAISEATPADVAARLWLGRTSVSSHGDRSSFEPASKAAELFRGLDDKLGLGEGLMKAGASLLTPLQVDAAVLHLDEALATLSDIGPTKQLASCLRSRAVAYYFAGDFEAARASISHSSVVAKTLGDTQGIANALIAKGELEFAAGDVDAAIATARNLIESEHANRRQLALALGNLTAYLLAGNHRTEAKLTAFNGLHKAQAIGWPAAIARMVEHLAVIAAFEGDLERAALLVGYTESFYARDTASREVTELVGYDRLCEMLSKDVAATLLADLRTEGAALTEGEAVKLALTS